MPPTSRRWHRRSRRPSCTLEYRTETKKWHWTQNTPFVVVVAYANPRGIQFVLRLAQLGNVRTRFFRAVVRCTGHCFRPGLLRDEYKTYQIEKKYKYSLYIYMCHNNMERENFRGSRCENASTRSRQKSFLSQAVTTGCFSPIAFYALHSYVARLKPTRIDIALGYCQAPSIGYFRV